MIQLAASHTGDSYNWTLGVGLGKHQDECLVHF